jgi:AcrR family transcriptional regulator
MGTIDTPASAQRSMRADARHNYECLLKAAHEVVAEHGSDASLEEIARRANVGVGTLYRHFPNRQALLEAIFNHQMTALVAKVDELLASPSPGEAYATWLHDLLVFSTTYRGLSGCVLIATLDENSEASKLSRAKSQAAAALLARAQEAGAVRADITSVDVGRLIHGIAMATERLPDRLEQAERLFALVLDSLRVQKPASEE